MIILKMGKAILGDLKRCFILQKKKSTFRVRNRHNLIKVTSANPDSLDISKITAGRYSYGTIDVTMYSGSDGEEGLDIGDFCSIALGSRFICGGEHNYQTLSTYPFGDKILHTRKCEARSKGKIVLADDVWIGSNALILSGVHVGQGAIIGAGSVVTKDVPPYAIVGGNPARVIKYRFPLNVVEQLIKFDFSKLTEKQFKLFGEQLMNTIETPVDAQRILELIN